MTGRIVGSQKGVVLITVALAVSAISVLFLLNLRNVQTANENQRAMAQSYSKSSLGLQIVGLLQDMNACFNTFRGVDFTQPPNTEFTIPAIVDAQTPPQARYTPGQTYMSHQVRLQALTLKLTAPAANVAGESPGGLAQLTIEAQRAGSQAGGTLKPFTVTIDYQLWDPITAPLDASTPAVGSLRRCRASIEAVEDKWRTEERADGQRFTVYGSFNTDKVIVGTSQDMVGDKLHVFNPGNLGPGFGGQAYFLLSGASNFYDSTYTSPAPAGMDYVENYSMLTLTTDVIESPSVPGQSYFDGWAFAYKNGQPVDDSKPLFVWDPSGAKIGTLALRAGRSYAKDLGVAMSTPSDGRWPWSFTIDNDHTRPGRVLKWYDPGKGPPFIPPQAHLHVHAVNEQGTIFVSGDEQTVPLFSPPGIPTGELNFAAGLYLSSDVDSIYNLNGDPSRSHNSWLVSQQTEPLIMDTEMRAGTPPNPNPSPDNIGALQFGRMRGGSYYPYFQIDDDFGSFLLNHAPPPTSHDQQIGSASWYQNRKVAIFNGETSVISINPPAGQLDTASFYSRVRFHPNLQSYNPLTPLRKHYELVHDRDLITSDNTERTLKDGRLSLNFVEGGSVSFNVFRIHEETGLFSIGFDPDEDPDLLPGAANCKVSVNGRVALFNHNPPPSDKRVKRIKGPYTRSEKALMEIQPIEFHWKDPSLGREKRISASAQEIEKLYPEAVLRDSRGFLRLDQDPLFWSEVNYLKHEIDESKGRESDLKIARDEIAQLKQRLESLRHDEP